MLGMPPIFVCSLVIGIFLAALVPKPPWVSVPIGALAGAIIGMGLVAFIDFQILNYHKAPCTESAIGLSWWVSIPCK